MRVRRTIFVTGTGTGVGKTHAAEALLRRATRMGCAVGLKPIETGVVPGAMGEDSARLDGASSFHVKHFPRLCFVDPISPHLAAEREGRTIDIAAIRNACAPIASDVDILLIELAGGLFTPLAPDCMNAHLIHAFLADARFVHPSVILVAPDRLGVLHDVIATQRAASSMGIPIHAVLMNATAEPDASTATNATQLSRFLDVPIFGPLSRGTPAELASTKCIESLLHSHNKAHAPVLGCPP